MKSASQVRILGVAVGWSLLPGNIRGSVSSCSATEQLCSEEEEEILEELLLERGIKYHSIAFIGGVLSVRKTSTNRKQNILNRSLKLYSTQLHLKLMTNTANTDYKGCKY